MTATDDPALVLDPQPAPAPTNHPAGPDSVERPARTGWRIPRPRSGGARQPAVPDVQPAAAPAEPRGSARAALVPLAVVAGYLLAAVYVSAHLLLDPAGRVQRINPGGQLTFEALLSGAVHALGHGQNLLDHGPVLGLTVPFAPVTALVGAPGAYAALSVLALVATATSWYALLARHVVSSRLAAAAGGWLCAFAPGLIAQANGHPAVSAQFLVPWLAWAALGLREHTARRAVLLAAVVVWQYFIDPRVLLLTVVGVALLLAVYAVRHRAGLRVLLARYLLGLAVAGLLSAAALAYPLWYLSGSAAHPSGSGLDAWAYLAFGAESLGGDVNTAQVVALPGEQTAYFGWGLVLLAGVLGWWLRRNWLTLGLAVPAGVFALLSLGDRIVLRGHHTGVPGPWALVGRLPLADRLAPAYLALAVAPLLGVLVAVGCDRYLCWSAENAQRPYTRMLRLAGATLLAIALVPIAPTPQPVLLRSSPAAHASPVTVQPAAAPTRTAGEWLEPGTAG